MKNEFDPPEERRYNTFSEAVRSEVERDIFRQLSDIKAIYDEFCPKGEAFLIDSLFGSPVMIPGPWWRCGLDWINRHMVLPLKSWMSR